MSAQQDIKEIKLPDFINYLDMPVMVLRVSGEIEVMNHHAAEITKGSNIFDLLGKPQQAIVRKWLDDPNTPLHTELNIFRKKYQAHLSAYPAGQWILQLHDVSSYETKLNRLNRILEERDLLMRELHHRVKNNLQTIMSLVYIKSADDLSDMNNFVQDITSDIRAISLIHERLIHTGQPTEVSMQNYLSELCHEIYQARDQIYPVLNIEVEECQVAMDMAVNWGLIVSELLSNIRKHAGLEGIDDPEVSVLFRKWSSGFLLELSDNGKGMKNTKYGTGLHLIQSLAERYDGYIKIKSERGTHTKVFMKYGK